MASIEAHREAGFGHLLSPLPSAIPCLGILWVHVYAAVLPLEQNTVEPLLKWFIPRRLRLGGLSIRNHNEFLTQFLAMTGSALLWIDCCSTHVNNETGCQQAMGYVARWRPNVQKLNVRVGGLWDKCLLMLALAFQRLTVLSLSNLKISTHGLAAALTHCSALEHLKIETECEAVPVEIALPTLRSIDFVSRGWSDAVMTAIGRKCARSETLLLVGSSELSRYGVTDAGVRAVLEGCPLLRETDVEYAAGISEDLRIELARRRNLTTLDVGR
jgi:hypothetical protein